MTSHPVNRRKKLIEVAIPLEAINAASAREKSIRHGHPSTLHLWWARRPLAAARAVIFCQMVDDPSAVPEEFPTEEDQEIERLRLFALISELVTWENTTNEQVLNRARAEIRRSWRRACADNADHPEAAELFNPEKLPGFHDPFAGGGALPLEAQRLGLEAYASDLNPVAVLINKAMIEIPPRFAGQPPVNPESRRKQDINSWKGAQGLAEDVRYYGQWMRDAAEKRIGHLYPQVEITAEMAKDRPDLNPYVGKKLTIMAWLWARTVKSPNPSFREVYVPLVSTYLLAQKPGKEAYIKPIVDANKYRFEVHRGKPANREEVVNGTKIARGGNFKCILSGDPMNPNYIRTQGNSGLMGSKLIAVVAEGNRERVYLSPSTQQEEFALNTKAGWRPNTQFVEDARAFTPSIYGLKEWGQLFTERQLCSLNMFSELISEVRILALNDCREAGIDLGLTPLSGGGKGSNAYADAVATYMGFTLDRLLQQFCTLSVWSNNPAHELVVNAFGRQALAMTWDYAEVNPFCEAASWTKVHFFLAKAVDFLCNIPASIVEGKAIQESAQVQNTSKHCIVSTDPPYYDNVPYADLSDFFYVWLRHSLQDVHPEIFATVAVPKSEELVAFPYRHEFSRTKAESFFLDGMTSAMRQISTNSHPGFPATIYYAFKQAETNDSAGSSSTGWETFLSSVMRAGFSIVGTWPVRTEKPGRMVAQKQNALSSSVVLVCQRRDQDSPVISRSEFRRKLRVSLPISLRELEKSNIPPVDVAQAAIGPGMAIYSSARAVLNPDDSPMSVREALIEINAALDEYLSTDEGELDADSRFALTFFESFGYKERDFGDAEGLAKARNLSVAGVAEAGILRSVAGKVRLLARTELPEDWDPVSDKRLCVWEATQQLIKRLEADGEDKAAELLLQLKTISGHGDLAANCRALAYRLYNHCEKTKQAEEARAYNGLVIAWPELEKRATAASSSSTAPLQTTLI